MIRKRVIVCILLLVLIGIQMSNVVAASIDNSFFNTNKKEISQGETLEMTLDIDKIKYDKFEFKLSSNLDTNNIVINENVEIENNNNNISINIDKSKISLNKITFYSKVLENIQVGTKIELNAQIIVEEVNTSSEIEYKVVENKKIDVLVVEKKQTDNKSEQNEQINAKKFEKTEKQEMNFSNNETKKTSEDFNMNSAINKTMVSGKAQSTTFSASSVNFSSTSSMQVENQTAIYNGSNNNYLSNLEIEGESLNTSFNKENTTYFIETTGKTELNVNVTKENETSKVYITGNKNLKTGDNKILISVTAENGDVRYYRVFVTNK